MSIEKFIEELDANLHFLSRKERKEIINYYIEYTNDLLEEGNSEESVINDLGDIKKIVNDLNENQKKRKENFYQIYCLF